MLLLLLLVPLLLGQGGVESQSAYRINVTRSVDAKEGQCIYVSCTVVYPKENRTDPVHGYWFRENYKLRLDTLVATNDPNKKVRNEMKRRFHLLGDPEKKNCSLDIRYIRIEDSGSYYFRVERGSMMYSYKTDLLSVHVTALTQKLNIKYQGPLKAGHPSTLTCTVPSTCERRTPPIFSWIGTSISPRNSSMLTFTPQPQDDGTSITCQVTFPEVGVITRKTIQLEVFYQNMTITAFQGNGTEPSIIRNGSSLYVQAGQYLRLVCVTRGKRSVYLNWMRGSLTLRPSQPLNPGILELPQVHARDEGQYTCRAQNSLGFQDVSLYLTLHKAWYMSGVVLSALEGVLVLFFFICIVVKSYRKTVARTAVGTEDKGTENANTSMGQASQGHLVEFQISNPPEHDLPAVDSEKEEGLHYASLIFNEKNEFLSFNEKNPAYLQKEKATGTEYSDIKTTSETPGWRDQGPTKARRGERLIPVTFKPSK